MCILTTDSEVGWLSSGCSNSVGDHTAVAPLMVAQDTVNGEGVSHALDVWVQREWHSIQGPLHRVVEVAMDEAGEGHLNTSSSRLAVRWQHYRGS